MDEIGEWVSLGKAARILGVHPATVRTWADRGEVPCRRTPGGHRRFRRADLAQWADARHSGQPAEAQLIVQSALGCIFTEIEDGRLAEQEWCIKISHEAQEALHLQLRSMMDALMHHLANSSGNHIVSTTAAEVGRGYAETVRAQGLTPVEAVRGFAFVRHFIVDSAIKLSETSSPCNPSEWGDLLRRVYAFTDEVLRAIVELYQAG
jgi:excisionase family DNA binding protein